MRRSIEKYTVTSVLSIDYIDWYIDYIDGKFDRYTHRYRYYHYRTIENNALRASLQFLEPKPLQYFISVTGIVTNNVTHYSYRYIQRYFYR